MIRFEDVSFSYDLTPDRAVLQDVSFEAAAGSLTLITGPSGAGKSTLCNLIAGYAPHQFTGQLDGKVIVGDRNVADQSIGELAQDVGMVFENPFDQLTGATRTLFDEVAFGLENRGLGPEDISTRVLDSLRLVGLEEIYERHPRQLSGGQSQRLAIATVLAVRPKILVLDEPSSQLDPVGSDHVAGIVGDLLREGLTLVVVSHDLDRWLALADRLICLDGGRVHASGSPPEVMPDLLASGLIVQPPPGRIWHRLIQEGYLSADTDFPVKLDDLRVCLAEFVNWTSVDDRN